MKTGLTWESEKLLIEQAERNLGLFTAAEWEAAGLTREQLRVRRRRGTVHRVFNGVYCLASSSRTHEFKIRAGTLRAGPVAAAMGATAAAKHGLMQPVEPIHIATVRRLANDREAFRFHQVALFESEIVVVDGAPITDICRTMLDACGYLHPKRATTLYRRAKRLELITDAEAAQRVEEEARQGRRGITLMRSLATEDLGDLTRLYSDLEIRFLEFFRHWGFPEPMRNVTLDLGGPFPWRPDFFWLGPQPLAADIDDHFTHAEDWERDREKDRAVEERGIRMIRLTGRMLDDEPTLARRLRVLLPS